MEDGFLRSASLGASHATPYSLVMDTRGIHYDPNSESDLEKILNEAEFSSEELAQANECMSLLKDLNLSKYNPPTLVSGTGGSIKIRRRVAVIGQVDNDRSVQLGNRDSWTMKELIQLAKVENPDAEVIYRPHPDVYQGYQRSKFRARGVAGICTIANPDVPITEFLGDIDRVYTITSLTGLEALIRGIQVTVVGAAFYAGWGLTDDRVKICRRKRVRSLVELFAAVYLKYPMYLANLDDPEQGFKSACLAIKVDNEVEKFQAIRRLPELTDLALSGIASTDHWPQLLFNLKYADQLGKLIPALDIGKIFAAQPGKIFHIALAYSVCGACTSHAERDSFLSSVRPYIDAEVFGQLLMDLSAAHPGQYVAKQFAWLLNSLRNPLASIEVLANELRANLKACAKFEYADDESKSGCEQGSTEAFGDVDHETSLTPHLKKLSDEQADLRLEIFQYHFLLRQFDDALEAAKALLIQGKHIEKLLPQLAELAELRFDFSSARALAKFVYFQSLAGSMPSIEVRTADSAEVLRDPWSYLSTLAKIVALRPGKLAFCFAMIKRFEQDFDASRMCQLLTGMLALNGDYSIGKAQALLAIEEPAAALTMLEDLIDAGDHSANTRVAYAQALSFGGRLTDALKVMLPVLKTSKTSLVYREVLRLYILTGNYESAADLVADARLRRIDIGEMLPRKVYFGARRPAEALQTFTELQIVKNVRTYYGRKYLSGDSPDRLEGRLAILAIFGPGDELRFSSIYNFIPELLPNMRMSVTCDPRLTSIFHRSFPHLEFFGVPRLRDSDKIDLASYSRVPGSDICYIVNNDAADLIEDCDKVVVVTDLLHTCLPGYEAFRGSRYLIEDADLRERYRARLPKEVILVGLSWRSSITTHSRNEHYLTIEEVAPIFELPGIQFVNFQYDDCTEELRWVEARYPGKLINFDDIDQFNDFESVAALMSCMNLMISPATTVVELAGALGCRTWMLSNSSELHWRKIDEDGTDVWHHSISHVEGAVLGNKESLVIELRARLLNLLTKAESVREESYIDIS